MRDRALIHRNKIDDFKQWLTEDGWELQPLNGAYEIIRARRHGERAPIIYYERLTGDHLTAQGRALTVALAYIRGRRCVRKAEQK